MESLSDLIVCLLSMHKSVLPCVMVFKVTSILREEKMRALQLCHFLVMRDGKRSFICMKDTNANILSLRWCSFSWRSYMVSQLKVWHEIRRREVCFNEPGFWSALLWCWKIQITWIKELYRISQITFLCRLSGSHLLRHNMELFF